MRSLRIREIINQLHSSGVAGEVVEVEEATPPSLLETVQRINKSVTEMLELMKEIRKPPTEQQNVVTVKPEPNQQQQVMSMQMHQIQ